MAQNLIDCAREQVFLMPPDLREWLPEGHMAWFVIDAVAEMDLTAFYAAYRQDGHGRAAYEPSMMVASLLYSRSALPSETAISRGPRVWAVKGAISVTFAAHTRPRVVNRGCASPAA